MDHISHSSYKIDRVEHIDPLRTVRKSYRDTVPFPYSESLESLCALFDLANHLAIADASSHEYQSIHIRILLCCRFYCLKQSALGVLQMKRYVAEVLFPRRLYDCRRFCFSHFQMFRPFYSFLAVLC